MLQLSVKARWIGQYELAQHVDSPVVCQILRSKDPKAFFHGPSSAVCFAVMAVLVFFAMWRVLHWNYCYSFHWVLLVRAYYCYTWSDLSLRTNQRSLIALVSDLECALSFNCSCHLCFCFHFTTNVLFCPVYVQYVSFSIVPGYKSAHSPSQFVPQKNNLCTSDMLMYHT